MCNIIKLTLVATGFALYFALSSFAVADDCDDEKTKKNDIIDVSPVWIDAEKYVKELAKSEN